MDDYLSKPMKKHELAEVLEKWLKVEAPAQNARDISGTALLFDETQLLANFDDDEDFAQSILKEGLVEIPKEVQNLQELCKSEDVQAIRLTAHTIKGMAANLCTPALRDVALKIETAIKNGDPESARELLVELERTALRTLEAIRGWL
jgi:HPt (histidine-containing phosphotransfer) domain-containing protein